jgi:hypothetical protein
MDSVDLDDDGDGAGRVKGPPPVQPPQAGSAGVRQTQPSMSIEQAAKPSFNITVGDPHKVGDLTSSHIVYQVRTKVRYVPAVWKRFTELIGSSDDVKGISKPRVCSESTIPRLPMALQLTTRQQPGRRCATSTRETSRWSLRQQLRRIKTSCSRTHAQ